MSVQDVIVHVWLSQHCFSRGAAVVFRLKRGKN